jgi:hypothetical protein
MKTFTVPPIASPVWREIYLVPPDVRTGRWCPIDDTTLQIRLDGWACPRCGAAWDFQGLAGWWLTDTTEVIAVAPTVRWRPSAVAVLTGLAGCAVTAAFLVAGLSDLDERLLLWLIAVVATAAVLLPTAGWLSRRIADWPYRHNRVLGTYDYVEQALAAPTSSEARDAR